MKRFNLLTALACVPALCTLQAQEPQGPFPPDEWPASANPDAVVHYVSVGDLFEPLGPWWTTGNMQILTGGDQNTQAIRIGGQDGLKAVDPYLNIADFDYAQWAEEEEIDILMQVYGDSALLNAAGEPRNFNFLIGTLPHIQAPVGGQIPVEARNSQWNWVLFRIPNTVRDSDGLRRIGTIPADAAGNTAAGGVNGGTIRMEQVQNLIVRVVAFGQVGAFGEPEQVNQFASGGECPPLPDTNLAWIDFASEQSHQMEVINRGDQTVVIETGIGPAGDLRRAVRAEGSYMNFGITEEYLGAACNEAQTVKICVEYFDDPEWFGTRFGPEAYATDSQGGISFVPDTQYQVLQGTGTWQRRSWIVPAVNLFGVNAAPLTAGPRFFFEGPVYISQFNLGILRTGNHPLAGQDPIPDCFADPAFCEGIYGTYAELDLNTGLSDGLSVGSSGGDQEMIEGEAGPEGDRRWAVRPAREDGSSQFQHPFLNFAILDEKLGPSSQPGMRLSICVTYYDDPALAGATFRPEVYISDRGGTTGFAFTSPNVAVTLQGTDTWRDAYFEITNVKLNGVNQGPQAAARFLLSDKIYFTRVRYGAIRPCGPEADVNPLEECKPPPAVEVGATRNPDGTIVITWPINATSYILEENTTLESTGWTQVEGEPVAGETEYSITVTPEGTRFYRLRENL